MIWKYIKGVILILSVCVFFITAHPVIADSGACSYHGGVNCATGPSTYGNAVCNDGWESSTSYYSTDECKVDSCDPLFSSREMVIYLKTPLQEIRSLEKNGVDSLIAITRQTIGSIQNSLDASIQQLNQQYSSLVSSTQASCQNQVQATQARAAALNPYSNNSSAAQGLTDSISSSCNSQISSLNNQQNIAIQSERARTGLSLTRMQWCLTSLEKLKSDMAKADNYCTDQYGGNAESGASLVDCRCRAGYEFDATKSSCITIPVCQLNSTRATQGCVCNTGYELSQDKTACNAVVIPVIPVPTIAPTVKNTKPVNSTPVIPPVKKVIMKETPAPGVVASSTKAKSNVATSTQQKTKTTPSVWVKITGWLSFLNPFRGKVSQ